ncbi:MAG TPA: gamma-glutamyltransferase family protein [Steroidobacteraceae bacterium]
MSVGFTARPELSGIFGAVASTHWIASACGMKILEAGGNAFDAAAATGFVLQVVEPHLNGPGGDAPILAARHDDAEPTVICGQGGAPAAATLEAFESLGLDLIPGTGLLAACVPGAFGAWLTLLRDFGTLSLRSVLEPAIDYASTGHPLLQGAVDTITSVRELFVKEWPTSAAVFLPNGALPRAGSLFANPTLGSLYAAIVAHAEAVSKDRVEQIDAALGYWYEGPVAAAIDEFSRNTAAFDVTGRRHHGLIRATDLEGWRPPIEKALGVRYHDQWLYKCGPWSQGPTMLQALKILEGFRLGDLDPEGPEFIHLVTETIKLVMADREAWYGDDPEVPLAALLSNEYAAQRRALIGTHASRDVRPGAILGRRGALPHLAAAASVGAATAGGGEPTFAGPLAARGSDALIGTRGDTCHLDIVDRWGNMVSATPSGGWLQSSPVIPRLGFALGTRLQMFWLRPGHANSLAPKKRPRTTLTPSMSFKQGRPYLAFGTPGGDQQEQWSLQLFLRHVDMGQPLQYSIESPAFHTDHLVSSFWPREIQLGSLTLEGRHSEATVEALRNRGHTVSVGGPWSEGRLSACARDLSGNSAILRAGANPRGMQGYAIAR